MHTALSTPFVYRGVSYTGNLSNIAQGDNFLSIVVPQIMASEAYRRNGVIVIWNDETEGANADDFTHTSVEIVISRLAKGYAFANSKDYTHSSLNSEIALSGGRKINLLFWFNEILGRAEPALRVGFGAADRAKGCRHTISGSSLGRLATASALPSRTAAAVQLG